MYILVMLKSDHPSHLSTVCCCTIFVVGDQFCLVTSQDQFCSVCILCSVKYLCFNSCLIFSPGLLGITPASAWLFMLFICCSHNSDHVNSIPDPQEYVRGVPGPLWTCNCLDLPFKFLAGLLLAQLISQPQEVMIFTFLDCYWSLLLSAMPWE